MTKNEMREARRKLKANSIRDKKTKCLVWQASSNRGSGYGQVRWKQRVVSSHRLAYEAFVGEIPESSVVHHTCANKICINPKHLQLVTPQENLVEMLERTSMQKKIVELERRLAKYEPEEVSQTNG